MRDRSKPYTCQTSNLKSNDEFFLKFFLKPSEFKILELKEKKVREFYTKNDDFYNQNDHVKTFLLNIDNDELLALLLKLSISDNECKRK